MNEQTEARAPRGNARMREDSRPQTRDGEGRRARVPLGIAQLKLRAGRREGYRRRWINDKPGRLDAALAAGYEFAQDGVAGSTNPGSRISRPVDVNEDGSPRSAYLMEIPEEFYREDFAAKQAALDETDAAIRAGNIQGKSGQDGRYVPDVGITYEPSTGSRPAR